MNPNYIMCLALMVCMAQVFPPILAMNMIHGGLGRGKGLGTGLFTGVRTIKKISKAARVLPVIAAKKGFFLAPMALPLALGGKALLAAKLAIPMGIGAAIGAPIGAFIGAKTGAIKAGILTKALIGAKILAAKKLAVAGTALAVKPFVLAAGAKAAIAGAGVKLAAKGISAAGAALAGAGKTVGKFSDRFKDFSQGITSFIPQAMSAAPALTESFQFPSLPLLSIKPKEPSSLEASFTANSPLTGYKYGKATFYSVRRRRSADPQPAADPSPQAQSNAQQLLTFVRAQNAQQCLSRVICELSANPGLHGQEGVRFGRSLLSLESQADQVSRQHYRQAANTGVQSRNPSSCARSFPSCAFTSLEIVRLGNSMMNG